MIKRKIYLAVSEVIGFCATLNFYLGVTLVNKTLSRKMTDLYIASSAVLRQFSLVEMERMLLQ